MSFAFHQDTDRYFKIQTEVTDKFVIPFIFDHCPDIKWEEMNVLEVGCGEAGVLMAFLQKGARGVGIELTKMRAEKAMSYLHEFVKNERVEIINANIYANQICEKFAKAFDLIVLKDVIEHIPDQQRLLNTLRTFLKDNGKMFFAFPPWQMPFGGHQQICKSKILSTLPYIHLLPKKLYKALMALFGEHEGIVNEMLELKETGISIEQFEKLAQRANLSIAAKRHYLINPIYKWKFGLQPKEQFRIISAVPYARNFLTTGVYYILKHK